jgi:hypothetical protein
MRDWRTILSPTASHGWRVFLAGNPDLSQRMGNQSETAKCCFAPEQRETPDFRGWGVGDLPLSHHFCMLLMETRPFTRFPAVLGLFMAAIGLARSKTCKGGDLAEVCTMPHHGVVVEDDDCHPLGRGDGTCHGV